ncbi:MAG TPA: transcriptional regulator GcvA [Stellaceae bacterium]|jgi:LysR family glycine cleavage system transcriptional activator|nr:transcriptional regulator GcvA [Stellaceae bacterium]
MPMPGLAALRSAASVAAAPAETPASAHRLSRLPPLTALRAFVVAARHLSFARAAEELRVTPAAVGQQIRQLEAHLGCSLFDRNSRGLRLSEAGSALLPGLSEGFERILEAVAQMSSRATARPLTVSVTPSFAAKWLVPRLEKFNAAFPGIDVRISASMALVDFAAEDVDCSIRYGSGAYPDLVVEKLLAESVFPVCAPALLAGAHPLDHPAALAHHVMLHDDSPDRDASCPDWRMWLRAAGIPELNAEPGPRFNQSSLVLEAAIAGHGVALAKAQLALSDLRAGRLVRPFGAARRVEFAYYFVAPPERSDWPKVAAFREWLRREIREQPHDDSIFTA